MLSFNINNVYSRILSDLEERESESYNNNSNLKYNDSEFKYSFGYYNDDTSGMSTFNGKDIISYLEEKKMIMFLMIIMKMIIHLTWILMIL